MTTEKILIGKQCYVGYNMRNNSGGDSATKLAFLTYTPLDDSKAQQNAFDKRKSTVDAWHNRRWYNYKTHEHETTDMVTETIDNELLEGYQISKHVRRYSGWGSGNVVWRIEDPRGFEFEISSPNMASIMDVGTITNGVIEGKCILGWAKGKVVLLPENSQPYMDAIVSTEAQSHKVSMKDVSPGDTVVLGNEASTVGIYLGRFHYLSWTRFGNQYELTTPKRTSCFIEMEDGSLYVSGALKVARLHKKHSATTPDEYAKHINKMLLNGKHVTVATRDYNATAVCVSTKAMDPDLATLVIQPSDDVDDNFSQAMFYDLDGKLNAASGYGIYEVDKYALSLNKFKLVSWENYQRYLSTGYSGRYGTQHENLMERFISDPRPQYRQQGAQLATVVNENGPQDLFVEYGDVTYSAQLRYV